MIAADRLAIPLLIAFSVLGALLSFTLEPLVGRLVVPYFGGAVHVWTVCMMVFQGLLLAGYAWAHLVAHRIGRWHLLALAVPLLWLPIGFTSEVAPEAPLATLVLRMLVCVALPFWALTTTSVVAQTWLARSTLKGAQNPYPLYAASNVGSLVGLLAYPLVVEPLLGLQAQRWLWSGAYLAYLAVGVACWSVLAPSRVSEAPSEEAPPAPTWSEISGWLLLSAGPSALLLAVTNLVATEVGSFPLVWVVPLALYLGTFIRAFRDEGLSQGWIDSWPDAVLVTIALCTLPLQAWTLPLLFGVLTWTSLVFHGGLYALRPHPAHLTSYYLVLALGGWLGGLAVSIGAPLLLPDLWEGTLTGLFLAVVGVVYLGWNEREWWASAPIWLGAPRLIARMSVVAVVGFVSLGNLGDRSLDVQRGFYGVFRVVERAAPDGRAYRTLTHGKTIHGVQYSEPPAPTPLAYYHQGGPLHQAWELRTKPGRSAIVGLGAGAMAHWTEPGEDLVFYEIDPDNAPLARRWFTFIDDAPGNVEVRVGDARLVMATEADQRPYEVLLVDAFSGDGIPLHLCTREAFAIWTGRLTEEGVLVIHISNRFYDLRAVLGRIAESLGWSAVWTVARADPAVFDDPLASPAGAVAMTRHPQRLAPLVEQGWHPLGHEQAPLWTDDWSTVLLPLWHQLRPLSNEQLAAGSD